MNHKRAFDWMIDDAPEEMRQPVKRLVEAYYSQLHSVVYWRKVSAYSQAIAVFEFFVILAILWSLRA